MTKVENRTFSKGQFVFREGEEGDLAFVIKEGSVNIVKVINDSEKVLATIGRGAMFGEMALIDNKPRMASACSAEDGTTLIVITRQLFEDKLNKSNPFIRGLLHLLSEQVRNMTKSKTLQPAPKLEESEES